MAARRIPFSDAIGLARGTTVPPVTQSEPRGEVEGNHDHEV